MKKLISWILVSFALASTVLTAFNSDASSSDRLQLTAESNLKLVRKSAYVTGICGTITADVLAGEFTDDVILTSPKGETLSGNVLVPSDTVVSNGTDSMKVLIYGDVDRTGNLNILDVTAMLKKISKWNVDVCETAIDLNWDTVNDLSDVSLLMKKIAGWNVCLGVDIVPSQITLSYYDSDCTKIGVVWHSVNKTQTPAVQVVEGETDDFTNARTVYGKTTNSMGDNSSRAVIDGLEMGKTYSYRVGDASGLWSEPATFTMRSEDPENFTFVCFTDTQSQESEPGSYFYSAFNNALTAYPDTEFAIHCGDVVETVGYSQWSYMLNSSSEFLRRIPTMIVSGNHETSYAGSLGYRMQYDHFFTDMPEQTSYNDGYFYSFNYGDVHFVMLNTNKQGTANDELSDEQIAWLRADLEANDAKWTIAVMHHPIFSTGSGSTNRWEDPMVLAMRAQLAPLFTEYGVDVVLAGHDHIYYCTYPIDKDNNPLADSPNEVIDGTVYYSDPAGVVYTTPGCTGSSSRALYQTHPEYYRYTDQGLKRSYLAVTVEDDRLTVKLCVPAALGEAEILDSWGIIKK